MDARLGVTDRSPGLNAADTPAPAGSGPGGTQRARILGTILLVALPLLTLALVVLVGQLREGEARVAREREIVARATASTTGVLVADQVAALQSLALTEDVVNPALHGALPDLFQRIAGTNATLDGIGLWDEGGWNVATTAAGEPPPPARTVNVADRDYHRQVLATGRPYASEAVTARLRGTTVVFLAVPVTLAGGQRAVLSGAMALERLEGQLRATLPQPDIALLVVDGAGRAFIHPDPAVKQALQPQRQRPDVVAVTAGRSGTVTVKGWGGPGGPDLLAAHAPVPGTSWGVVLQQPVGGAYARERQDVISDGALLALAVLFSLGIGWALSGRLDVSYRRLASARAQADDARVAAEAAVTQRDSLLAGVAHDLRNPLAAVKGHVQLLRRRLDRDVAIERPRLQESLVAVDTILGSMTGMLNELLDAARLRSGRDLALRLAPTDVVALVRTTVQTQAETAERHRITVAAGPPALPGTLDGPRLQRVLANLLSNAQKYSPEGTTVRVTVEHEAGPQGGLAVITVQDAGVGIPAADLPRIFEPFYRGGNVVDRVGGVGLGLSGSRKIVEQHGGTISAFSREGEGSLFTVRLPLGLPADAPATAPAGQRTPAGGAPSGGAPDDPFSTASAPA